MRGRRTETRLAVVGLMLAAIALVPHATRADCGDVDDSGEITVTDGVRVLRAAALLGDDCDLAVCDADDDGQLTDVDSVRVLRAAAGEAGSLECGDLGPRRTMLRSLAAVVIVPGYQELDAAGADLLTAIEALIATPSEETLAATRTAWARERAAWKRTEAFRLGPSESLRTRARIDWSPSRPDRIEDTIASSESFTSADVEALGATVVGSLALEYLLFDDDGGIAGVLAALSGPAGASRRSYLGALAANLRERTAEVRSAWEPTEGDFGAELVEAGLTGGVFASLKEAVDELVNRVIFTVEIVEEAKLATPLGINRSGGPDPELLESPRSGSSLADIYAELVGIRYVYEGRTATRVGAGIGSVVRGISAAVDAATVRAIDDALVAVEAVPPPLSRTLVDDPARVEAAYLAVQGLRRVLVLDVAPALGVTLTFGGTDGD